MRFVPFSIFRAAIETHRLRKLLYYASSRGYGIVIGGRDIRDPKTLWTSATRVLLREPRQCACFLVRPKSSHTGPRFKLSYVWLVAEPPNSLVRLLHFIHVIFLCRLLSSTVLHWRQAESWTTASEEPFLMTLSSPSFTNTSLYEHTPWILPCHPPSPLQ